MAKSPEERLRHVEDMCEYLHSQHVAVQNLLIAALLTVNRDPASRAYFEVTLKAVAQGSYDHSLGTNWTDEAIAATRRTMAVVVGPDIAKACNLP